MIKKQLPVVYLLVLLFCCSCRSQNNRTEMDGQYVSQGLPEMELNLKASYDSIEQILRNDYNIGEQSRIDKMMQIFIDDGDVVRPFVFDYSNGVPNTLYLSYADYKKYRETHPIDTSNRKVIVHFDSIGGGKRSH